MNSTNPVIDEYVSALRTETRDLTSTSLMIRLAQEIDALTDREADATRLPPPAAKYIESVARKSNAHLAGACAKLLVLHLIDNSDARLEKFAIPDSVRLLYPDAYRRIARNLALVRNEIYVATGGDFERDLRLVSQISIPVSKSRYIDRNAYLNHHFYRYQGKFLNLKHLAFLAFKLHGLGPLFRIHVDERDLTDFNDAGCSQAYLHIAELLHLYPSIKGAVATSWLLDPQLNKISPNLTYSRRLFEAHGAIFRNDGPETHEQNLEHALKKSVKRRRMFENGEYIPTCFTVVWARRDLLRWANTPL